MDKFKGIAKGGWHPSGDKAIHRDSWKADLKGMTVNRNKDPYEAQRSHQSAPLASLRDPDSFGAPPKHSGWYDPNGTPSSPGGSSASSGLGAVVPTSSAAVPGSGGLGAAAPRVPARIPTKQEREQQMEEEERAMRAAKPRVDTSKQTMANLPKPPVRRGEGASPGPLPRNVASPPLPGRQAQPPPQRAQPAQPPRPQPAQAQPRPAQNFVSPPPMLPPRMTEHPDEYTPPPPPTYQEATVHSGARAEPQQQQQQQQQQAPAQNPAAINQGAAQRLGQAGVNVSGFGIGGSETTNSAQAVSDQPQSVQGHPSQLSELQQRFSRMGTGSAGQGQATSPTSSANVAAAAAAQKKPPPPPPKKAGLGGDRPGSAADAGESGSAPPPLPLSSKPRPG